MLRENGVDIRVISIPDGKDPDEFIKLHGPSHFRLLLERSANDVEYRLIALGKRHMLHTTDGKVAYLRDAAALLAGLSSPVERDVYAGKLAAELSVSKDAILSQVQFMMEKRQKQQKDRQLSEIVKNTENTIKKANPDAVLYPRAASAEEGLLGLLFLSPDLIGPVSKILPPTSMVTALGRKLYELMLKRYENGLVMEIAFFSSCLEEEEMGYLSRMVREAQERSRTMEDAKNYVDIIHSEYTLKDLKHPENLTDETLQNVLDTMRKNKK